MRTILTTALALAALSALPARAENTAQKLARINATEEAEIQVTGCMDAANYAVKDIRNDAVAKRKGYKFFDACTARLTAETEIRIRAANARAAALRGQ